jgi:hypothetical protein
MTIRYNIDGIIHSAYIDHVQVLVTHCAVPVMPDDQATSKDVTCKNCLRSVGR